MGCKRKHSSDDSSLSISSFGAVSPNNLDASMDLDACLRSNGWDFMSAGRVKSSDWGNRTCKRVRDNRPDERAIHENTLNKLFSAQRNHRDIIAPTSHSLSSQQSTLAISKPQKSTLHSFWKELPAPPVQPIFSIPVQLNQSSSPLARCDDCDTPLRGEHDSMDIDMDTDLEGSVEGSSFACNDCGRNVCGTCAVVSATRHCLQCATTGNNSRP
ncbi:hypothetical protein COCC4DRAFT_186031 [Bipolaris maydis ATCC 48331]|uniref:Uncharacterized protein n=2 Tax=Cochliobolus heterostrophus TaxID=5016 RepID=M2TSV5_COCH5|nr:uncharacterized protein COCC4DRAFT_186031 [Bipolaris maydis ATCC 48331]EMD89619.1 hypothetical protein COCHEDRAFT_1177339 [Bipolaris maydis C5]KAJ5025665.1 hypothetical protein J3E73DRAFT_319694 [Bipolaris maydis]ENI10168.1 hypothetical protein COCC4DRAFT_186031 [Bipolaris maydis ATCC 48331]KAJ5064277.1 hypothetical protein J3E74DRAFT_262712 [Bipolaris maydis]KAJ6196576.1 hypothetical protein J3E72DRAFT_439758 [Bipolaris maydis]